MFEGLEVVIPFLVLGGAWQLWDGSDHAGIAPTLVRLSLAGLIAAGALWYGPLPLIPAAVCGVVALLGIHLGYTKWESYKVMVPRFGGPALVVFLFSGSWIYLLLGLGVGILYPTLYGKFGRWEEVCRVFKGMALIGGLSLLGYIPVAPIITLGN